MEFQVITCTLRLILSFGLISLACLNSMAQANLVPNPSFEEYTVCPGQGGGVRLGQQLVSPGSGLDSRLFQFLLLISCEISAL